MGYAKILSVLTSGTGAQAPRIGKGGGDQTTYIRPESFINNVTCLTPNLPENAKEWPL